MANKTTRSAGALGRHSDKIQRIAARLDRVSQPRATPRSCRHSVITCGPVTLFVIDEVSLAPGLDVEAPAR